MWAGSTTGSTLRASALRSPRNASRRAGMWLRGTFRRWPGLGGCGRGPTLRPSSGESLTEARSSCAPKRYRMYRLRSALSASGATLSRT